MKNRISIFRFLCQKDINQIYEVVEEYLPDCDVDRLTQSIIYEEDRKIICRTIKNKDNEKVGKELIIQVYETGDIYRIKDKEDCIKYEKINKNTKEKIKIILDEYTIKRCFLYNKEGAVSTLEETYNLDSKDEFNNYLDSDSIEQCMYKLKNKNKIRKRT